MESRLALTAMLLAACTESPRQVRPRAPALMPVPVPDAPSFTAVHGWGVLTWDLSLTASQQALERVHIQAHPVPGAVGLFPSAEGPGSAAVTREVSLDELRFHDGTWDGSAHFKGSMLDDVTLTRTVTTHAEVDGLANDLALRYGATSNTPRDIGGATLLGEWSSADTHLIVTAVPSGADFLIFQTYRKLPRTWP